MALLPDIINAESEALNESNNSHVLPVTIDDDSIIFDDFADMDVSSAFWMEIVDMVNTNTRYTTPLIIVGGCVGNLMAVYVFSQTKLWRQSSNYYLSALCLSDTLFLLLTGLLYLTTYQHVNVYNRPGLCEAITYFSSLASFISVWLVVSFTAERYVAVAHPLRRANWCTSSRALHVLSTCVVVGATVNLPLLYFSDMVPNEVLNHTVCGVQKHKKDKLRMFNFIDMVCVFLLPMLLIIVFNTFIALRVWNDARVRGSMTSQHQTRMELNNRRTHRSQNSSNRSTISQKVTPRRKASPQTSGETTTRPSYLHSQRKVTKMLLFVSTVFIVLNMPSYIMRAWAFYATKTEETPTVIMVQNITTTLFLIGFSINFFLYCVSGQNFRKAAWNLLGVNTLCQQPEQQQQQDPATATVSEHLRRSYRSMQRTPQDNDSNITVRTLPTTTTIHNNTIGMKVSTMTCVNNNIPFPPRDRFGC